MASASGFWTVDVFLGGGRLGRGDSSRGGVAEGREREAELVDVDVGGNLGR